MPTNYYTIQTKPGIQRDGTLFDTELYLDGQWCRFYRKRPRKIGGYAQLSAGLPEIIRNLYVIAKSTSLNTYLGRPSSLKFIAMDLNGATSAEIDRTPLSNFVPNPDNTWSFDQMNLTDPGTGLLTTYLIANVSPTGADISSTGEGGVFYGQVNAAGPLVPIFNGPDLVTASGGIVVIPPYLFTYGDGIQWSEPNDVIDSTGLNQYFGNGIKFVNGFSSRGGGVPAGLFWSLNSLVRATFSPDPAPGNVNNFSFETVNGDISILASNSVVEYNQQYFWIGNGQFYVYNGIVNTLANTTNSNYFFNNLNYAFKEKIFGWFNARYKEIWWHYPSGDSEECNAVIMYNVEEQFWFDASINRSAAFPAQIFPRPIMSDSALLNGTYGLWQHEFGTDQVVGDQNTAIPSHFVTNIIDLAEVSGGNDRQFRVRRIEPDFLISGNMTVIVVRRAFANSVPVVTLPMTFNGDTERIDLGVMGRLVSFKFDSNEGGGFYEMGKVVIDFKVGDERPGS